MSVPWTQKDQMVIKNITTGVEIKDKLVGTRTLETLGCLDNICAGSTMGTMQLAKPCLTEAKKLSQAREFFLEYFKERNREKEFEKRWEIVSAAIRKNGIYDLSADELYFGARTAWRNAPRCVGRKVWNSLKFKDCRHITSPEEAFKAICTHISDACDKNGIIKPIISVFPARQPNGQDPFRVWNSQLISYAGYASPNDPNIIIGDAGNLQFTQFCEFLGWKGKGGRFDVLPIVLSGPDGLPVFFEYPEDLILGVKISHPTIPQFADLGLKWYAIPAVSGMLLEVGGVQFPACPFNGWYAVSEIATADFLNIHRYNLLNEIGTCLGYDITQKHTFWQDKVNIEVNVAVLHSFKKYGLAIQDHHTLAEQFMEHFYDEHKNRGGCPADWVWIVPPVSSGLCPTYHQEMRSYHISPSFEYQDPPWKNYKMSQNKLSLNGVGIATMFSSAIYLKQYLLRQKVYVFYGTMTGTSQKFAKKFATCLDQIFQVQLMALEQKSLELMETLGKDGSLAFIVAATTGDGDAPQHALAFQDELKKAKKNGVKPLKRLKYSVFALGSSTYEHFCAFGKYCDRILEELGADRIAPLVLGDEQKSQTRAFQAWALEAIQNSSANYDINLSDSIQGAWPFTGERKSSRFQMDSKARLQRALSIEPNHLIKDMKSYHGVTLEDANIFRTVLLSKKKMSDRYMIFTLGFKFSDSLNIEPGDHIKVFAENDPAIVDEIMKYLIECPEIGELLAPSDTDLPDCTLRKALTSYLDLTSIPTQEMILKWAPYASDEESTNMKKLAKDLIYKNWKTKCPGIAELFNMFQTLKIPTITFVNTLNKLLPRTYSASSMPGQTTVDGIKMVTVDLFVSLVDYEVDIPGKFSRRRQGVCCGFLDRQEIGTELEFLTVHRVSSMLKMPCNPYKVIPVIMVSTGSGVAPFRAFWQARKQMNASRSAAWLYFGCRDKSENFFEEEAKKSVNYRVAMSRVAVGAAAKSNISSSNSSTSSVTSSSSLGMRRSTKRDTTKMYVQDLLIRDRFIVYDVMVNRGGHLYTCGKMAMSKGIVDTLKKIMMDVGAHSPRQTDEFIHQLQNSGRLEEEYQG